MLVRFCDYCGRKENIPHESTNTWYKLIIQEQGRRHATARKDVCCFDCAARILSQYPNWAKIELTGEREKERQPLV